MAVRHCAASRAIHRDRARGIKSALPRTDPGALARALSESGGVAWPERRPGHRPRRWRTAGAPPRRPPRRALFWIFGDIFRSKDLGGGAKTFWVFFVIFLPWLGILVYLIARGGGMTQRAIEQQHHMQAAQEQYIKKVAASSGGSATDQIASAKSLLESGAITQAEFDALKAKALA